MMTSVLVKAPCQENDRCCVMLVLFIIGASVRLADAVIVMSPLRSIESGVVLLLLQGAQLLHSGIDLPVGNNAALLLGTAAASWTLTLVKAQQSEHAFKLKGSFL